MLLIEKLLEFNWCQCVIFDVLLYQRVQLSCGSRRVLSSALADELPTKWKQGGSRHHVFFHLELRYKWAISVRKASVSVCSHVLHRVTVLVLTFKRWNNKIIKPRRGLRYVFNKYYYYYYAMPMCAATEKDPWIVCGARPLLAESESHPSVPSSLLM